MRRIDKSYEIINGTVADFKTGTQQHIENAVQETGHMLLKTMFPNFADANGDISVLYGCVNTGSGSNYIISAGAISYKSPDMDEPELFYVNQSSFTVTGGNAAVAIITTASYTGSSPQGDVADPVGMSDNTTQNIHNIRTITLVNGNSSTTNYIAAYSSFVFFGNEIQTDTSNGQTLDVNITAGGPFAYTGLITNYSYRIIGNRCELDFNIVATITDGATVDQIKIPLPVGITKNTSLNKKYSARGTCAYIAPGSTTDYVSCYVNAIDDGTEGQRLVIRRAEGSAGAVTMDISTSSVLTLSGHIDFQIV